jgi:hypothetical protein
MARIPIEVPAESEGETTIADKDAERPDIGQYFYTDAEKQRLASDPEFHLLYRKRIEFAINAGFAIFYKNTEASNMARAYMVAEMERQLESHPVLTKKLIPSWAVGCR